MRFHFIPLEERIVLDAAGAAGIVDSYALEHHVADVSPMTQEPADSSSNTSDSGALDKSGENHDSNSRSDTQKSQDQHSDQIDQKMVDLMDPLADLPTRVLVVSSQVQNAQALAQDALSSVKVVVYDVNTTTLNELTQKISDVLGGQKADSIAFANLGQAGQFEIINGLSVSLESLQSNSQLQTFWQHVGDLMKTDGRIDLLACSVGSSQSGVDLVNQLDQIMATASNGKEISVAASTDKTGNPTAGANWNLEIGNINAAKTYFNESTLASWSGILDNTAPTVVNDTFTLIPDGYLDQNVLANDSDPNGDAMTASLIQGPNKAVDFSLNADGSFFYTAIPAMYGVDSFTYQVTDSGGNISDIATVTINLDAPPTTPDYYFSLSSPEKTLTIALADPDNIASSHPLTITFGDPSFGTLSNLTVSDTQASINYLSGSTQEIDSITYTVTDYLGASSTGTIHLVPSPLLEAPTAHNDIVSIYQDQVLHSGSILGNDQPSSAYANGPLSISQITIQPLHGTLSINSDGTFTYEHNSGFIGIDTFSYIGLDSYGQTTNEATTGIYVIPVDAPSQNFNSPIVFIPGVLTTINLNDLNGGTKLSSSFSTNSDLIAYDAETQSISLLDTTSSTNSSRIIDADFAQRFSNLSRSQILSNAGTSMLAQANQLEPTVLHLLGPDGPIYLLSSQYTIWIDGAPNAQDTSYSMGKDQSISVTINAQDPDNASSDLKISVSSPLHGTLTTTTDGIASQNIIYTPDAGFIGVENLSYTVTDSFGASSTSHIAINVITPDLASNDSYSARENVSLDIDLSGGVLANDTIQSSGSAIIDTQPLNGTLIWNSDGSFTYTPTVNFVGSDSFTYHILNDSGVSGNSATVSIHVDGPSVSAHSYEIVKNGQLTTTAINGTLLGATDSAGLPISVISYTTPDSGNLLVNADGSFTYNPIQDFVGNDYFNFTVQDSNGGLVTGTAVIKVLAPSAKNNDYLNVQENTTYSISDPQNGFLANDILPAGDTIVSVTASIPEQGQVVVQNDGTFIYTPKANYYGNDSFTYSFTDSAGNIETATVNIVVNGAPIAISEQFIVNENTTSPLTGNLINVLANDINPIGGDPIISTQPLHGTLSANGDGTFTYTPNLNYYGMDSFSYYSKDSQNNIGNIVTDTIKINGTPVSVDDAINAQQNSTLNSIDVLSNDLVSADSSIVNLTQPSHGTVTINNDNTLTYAPNANYYGDDSFTYSVKDAFGVVSDLATVTVNISGTPISLNDSYTISENNSLIVTSSNGVMNNDATPQGGLTTIVDSTTHGVVSLAQDGSFIYTPDADFYGTDSFTYIVTDTSGNDIHSLSPTTVNITVTGSPNANADAYSVSSGSILSVSASAGVLANDAAPLPLHAVLLSGPAHAGSGGFILNGDGSFSYTPAANFTGTDTFTYNAVDSNGVISGTPAVVTLLVNGSTTLHANNDSYVNSENTTLSVTSSNGLLANDTPSGGLTASLVRGPLHGTIQLNADGTFIYIPKANYYGTDSFSYRSIDSTGQKSNLATVSITVNGAPIAVNNAYTVKENSTNDHIGSVLINDLAPRKLTAVLASGPTSGAALTLNANGTFIYTPIANFIGTDTFTYQAKDANNILSNIATVTISVSGPQLNSDTYSTNENTSLTIAPDVILPAGDTIRTIKIMSQPSNGVVKVSHGNIVYVPTKYFVGVDTFTYEVIDKNGAISNIATASINVAHVNQAPETIILSNSSLNEFSSVGTVVGTLSAIEPDAGVTETFSLVNSAGGRFALDGNQIVVAKGGSSLDFSKTPSYRVVVTATNSEGLSLNKTLTINLIDVAVAPITVNDAYTINYQTDSSATIAINALNGILSNDTHLDPDGNILAATLISGTSHGNLVLNNDGSFSYVADIGFSGTDTFTYKAVNGTALSTETTVTLNVNEAPILNIPNGQPVKYAQAQDPILLAGPSTIVHDDVANFNGETLTVKFANNGTSADKLSIIANGNITLNGNDILDMGTLVGSYSGGNNGKPLIITFNENASASDVKDVITSIGFSNKSSTPSTADRSVSFVMTDKFGASSIAQLETVKMFVKPEIQISDKVIAVARNIEVNIGTLAGLTFSESTATSSTIFTVNLSVTSGLLNFSNLSALSNLSFIQIPTVEGLKTIQFSGTLSDAQLAISLLQYETFIKGTDRLVILISDASSGTILSASSTITIKAS